MKKVICYGEILWDIFPDGQKPGGAPMNVAYHLHKQGVESIIISSAGDDENGRKLITYLEDMGLAPTFIQINPKLPTGTVDVTLDSEGNASYVINKPAAWDAIHFKKELAEKVESADAVVFGSLACREDESRNTLYQLLEHSKLKVLDLNLRPPYISENNLQRLLRFSTVLKLNDEEFNFLKVSFQITLPDEPALKELSTRFGLECICITMGEKGALVWYKDKLYRHEGFKIHVSDTVGSGDAFLASFICGYQDKLSVSDILNRACALGAYTASRAGATPEYIADEIYQRFSVQK